MRQVKITYNEDIKRYECVTIDETGRVLFVEKLTAEDLLYMYGVDPFSMKH